MTQKERATRLGRANLIALYIRDVADALRAEKDNIACAEALEKLSAEYLLNKELHKPVIQ